MNKVSLPVPTREDLYIFQGLQKALIDKKAYVKINFKKLNRFKSPFFNPWENVLPLMFILVLSLVLMIADNLIVGSSGSISFIAPRMIPFWHFSYNSVAVRLF